MLGKIESLKLVNFRSHKRTEITFDGRPVAILGDNGAGKTNLLEAISLFSPGRGLRRAEKDQLSRAPENLGWKLELSGYNTLGRFDIINQARFGEARQTLINDKPASQTSMAKQIRIVWMVPSMDRIWIDSASDRRKFFDRIVLTFVPEHGENVVAYEKAMRERNKLLKDGVSDTSWFEIIEERMAQSAHLIAKARESAIVRLNHEMSEGETAFPIANLSLNYESHANTASQWQEIWAQNRREERFAGITKYGVHKVSFDAEFVAKKQPAALCSTGEQKALLISLMLANARALMAEGAFTVVLLDEVVAHLDPKRRGDLFDALTSLDAHVFMTGTEEELFQGLGDRGQNIRIIDEDGESKIDDNHLS